MKKTITTDVSTDSDDLIVSYTYENGDEEGQFTIGDTSFEVDHVQFMQFMLEFVSDYLKDIETE